MVICEIGLNHNGDMKLAKRMICEAKNAGASLVKFQLYDADKDEPNNPWHDYLKQCELSFDQAKMLFDYGADVGIEVFFSVDNVERVMWCEKIGVKRYKIGCSHNKDNDLIAYIWQYGKPTIISYQGNFIGERIGTGLYCVPRYPAWISDDKCNEIEFPSTHDGISDHTIGIDAAKIALARGAGIIEKHFTLAKAMSGPDHCLSMPPDELRELVRWEKVCKEVL